MRKRAINFVAIRRKRADDRHARVITCKAHVARVSRLFQELGFSRLSCRALIELGPSTRRSGRQSKDPWPIRPWAEASAKFRPTEYLLYCCAVKHTLWKLSDFNGAFHSRFHRIESWPFVVLYQKECARCYSCADDAPFGWAAIPKPLFVGTTWRGRGGERKERGGNSRIEHARNPAARSNLFFLRRTSDPWRFVV